jgi:hypothetical protein
MGAPPPHYIYLRSLIFIDIYDRILVGFYILMLNLGLFFLKVRVRN